MVFPSPLLPLYSPWLLLSLPAQSPSSFNYHSLPFSKLPPPPPGVSLSAPPPLPRSHPGPFTSLILVVCAASAAVNHCCLLHCKHDSHCWCLAVWRCDILHSPGVLSGITSCSGCFPCTVCQVIAAHLYCACLPPCRACG